ncbi:MAG: amidohydrolase family protein [Spirochaetia bacterium]|jgi:cytosine/adenosine deaminase-related metal-dependent hydrolase
MLTTYSLSGLTVVTPDSATPGSSVQVDQKKLGRLGGKSKFDLRFGEGFLACPALINIHDHFNGNYLPKVGPPPGEFYINWSYWDRDFKYSDVIKVERAMTTVEERYFLSAYKNLFSGVVTANDHFPHEWNEPFIPRLPMRVIRNYTLSHACSSFDLKWGDGFEIEHARAKKNDFPFITHLEEGFDPETQAGIETLEAAGCLDEHTVMIHCIGFSDEDIQKVRRAGAHVSWCPNSNIFMYNVTCKIKKMLEAGINVSMGTDSTATGSVNLLEEMRFGRETYRKMYGEDLPAKTIVNMVTVNPARAFRIQKETGSLAEGKLADLLVLRQQREDPWESFVAAKPEDIELLVQDGSPLLGDASHEELFAGRGVQYAKVSVHGRQMLVKGDPAGLMEGVRKAVGFRKVLDFIPLDT